MSTTKLIANPNSVMTVIVYVTKVEKCFEWDIESVQTFVWVIPYATLTQSQIDMMQTRDGLLPALVSVNKQYCHNTNDLPYVFQSDVAFVSHVTTEK